MLNLFVLLRRCGTALILILSVSSLNSLAATIHAKTDNVLNEPMMQTLTFDQDISHSETGDTILVPLSGNEAMAFTINSQKTMTHGGTVITATSSRGVDLLLSSDNTATYGSIIGNDLKYTIGSDAKLGTVLVNQNHPTFPEIDLGNDGIVPANKSPDMLGIEQMAPGQKTILDNQLRAKANISSGGSRIRMLVVYSREFASGFGSPVARINQLLSFTNQSMQRSNVNLEFTLARAQVLAFDNNAQVITILNQVQAGAGAFANIPSLRNQVGADMVAVLSFQSGFSANGVAFVNGDNANFAFSATRLSPGCCDSVFAHELGHNMGSGHERASANPGEDNPCGTFNFTGFSCGHGNSQGNNGSGWGTVMSRLNSRVVNNVFSNPGLNCLGEPCGIPAGQNNSADNFRSFNMSRLLVANFRADPPAPTPAPTVIAPIIGLLLDEDD